MRRAAASGRGALPFASATAFVIERAEAIKAAIVTPRRVSTSVSGDLAMVLKTAVAFTVSPLYKAAQESP